jgi:hypothetical protein
MRAVTPSLGPPLRSSATLGLFAIEYSSTSSRSYSHETAFHPPPPRLAHLRRLAGLAVTNSSSHRSGPRTPWFVAKSLPSHGHWHAGGVGETTIARIQERLAAMRWIKGRWPGGLARLDGGIRQQVAIAEATLGAAGRLGSARRPRPLRRCSPRRGSHTRFTACGRQYRVAMDADRLLKHRVAGPIKRSHAAIGGRGTNPIAEKTCSSARAALS